MTRLLGCCLSGFEILELDAVPIDDPGERLDK